MLRSPKQTKFKSPHFHLSNKGLKGLKLSDKKSYFIKSQESYLFTGNQLEACRRCLAKPVKTEDGVLNIRFFPNLSLSKKPLQTRMGKGKGKHDKWVAPIEKGRPLFEISNVVPLKILNHIYTRVAFRLPVFSKLLARKKPRNRIFHLIENQKLTVCLKKKIKYKNDLPRNHASCNR